MYLCQQSKYGQKNRKRKKSGNTLPDFLFRLTEPLFNTFDAASQ